MCGVYVCVGSGIGSTLHLSTYVGISLHNLPMLIAWTSALSHLLVWPQPLRAPPCTWRKRENCDISSKYFVKSTIFTQNDWSLVDLRKKCHFEKILPEFLRKCQNCLWFFPSFGLTYSYSVMFYVITCDGVNLTHIDPCNTLIYMYTPTGMLGQCGLWAHRHCGKNGSLKNNLKR